GNVVGLETAAWKYFGRAATELSWAESATLAVLPNAPALIHPGRNREALLIKRNRLLDRLRDQGLLDSTSHYLAQLEPLPERPLPLPMLAPHLLERTHQERLASQASGPARIQVTLDGGLQQQALALVARHYAELAENGIHNAGALVLSVPTGDVLAYVGNTPCEGPGEGCAVDVIPARRSTGSILKPLLYAAMLQDGELLPDMLVPDVPAYYGSYHPANYDRRYQGAVPASQALARSLNVPAVHMLQRYGVSRFQRVLQQVGLTTIDRPADDYGLTLILGGAEASLWDLAGVYASMGRSLRYFPEYDGRYDPAGFRPPNLYLDRSQGPLPISKRDRLQAGSPLEAGPIWHTLQAMVSVARPESDRFWELFASSDRIAWKTGTS
ncbi:MAG: penicillin-binding protein 1C, partial [Bacteroidetes bacterium]